MFIESEKNNNLSSFSSFVVFLFEKENVSVSAIFFIVNDVIIFKFTLQQIRMKRAPKNGSSFIVYAVFSFTFLDFGIFLV